MLVLARAHTDSEHGAKSRGLRFILLFFHSIVMTVVLSGLDTLAVSCLPLVYRVRPSYCLACDNILAQVETRFVAFRERTKLRSRCCHSQRSDLADSQASQL